MIWYIALGSAVGGALRFLLGGWIVQRAGNTFPVHTLIINVSGSFLLGFLQRYGLEQTTISPEVRAMLTIGFCGGFTTFSAFSYETMTMLEEGAWARAALYAGLSVALTVAAAFAGIGAARTLMRSG